MKDRASGPRSGKVSPPDLENKFKSTVAGMLTMSSADNIKQYPLTKSNLRINVDLDSMDLDENTALPLGVEPSVSPNTLACSLFEIGNYFGESTLSGGLDLSSPGSVTMSPRIAKTHPLVCGGAPGAPISVSTPRNVELPPCPPSDAYRTPTSGSDYNPPDLEQSTPTPPDCGRSSSCSSAMPMQAQGSRQSSIEPTFRQGSRQSSIEPGTFRHSSSEPEDPYPRPPSAKKMKFNDGSSGPVQRPSPHIKQEFLMDNIGNPPQLMAEADEDSESSSRRSSVDNYFNMNHLLVPPIGGRAVPPAVPPGQGRMGKPRRKSWGARSRRRSGSRNRRHRTRSRTVSPSPATSMSLGPSLVPSLRSTHGSSQESPASSRSSSIAPSPMSDSGGDAFCWPAPVPLPPLPDPKWLTLPGDPRAKSSPAEAVSGRRLSEDDAKKTFWRGLSEIQRAPNPPLQLQPDGQGYITPFISNESEEYEYFRYDPKKTVSRKKTNVACIHCVRAKAGCDRGRPCARCVRLGKKNCVDRPVNSRRRRRIIRKRRFSAPEHGNNFDEHRFHMMLNQQNRSKMQQWFNNVQRQRFANIAVDPALSLSKLMPPPVPPGPSSGISMFGSNNPPIPPPISAGTGIVKAESLPPRLPPPIGTPQLPPDDSPEFNTPSSRRSSNSSAAGISPGKTMAAALKTLSTWQCYFRESAAPGWDDEAKLVSAALLSTLTYQDRMSELKAELLKTVNLSHLPIKLCHLVQSMPGVVKEENPNIMQLDYTFDYSYYEKARAVQYFIKANTKFVAAVGGPGNVNPHVMSSRWFTADTWAIHLNEFLNAHVHAMSNVHVWSSNVVVNNLRYEATFVLTFVAGSSSSGNRQRLKSWRVSLKPRL